MGFLAIGIALLGAAAAVAGPARIRIVSIHQARTLEPATISVFVVIAPAKENRGFALVAEGSQGAYHRTARQLEGDREDRPQPPIELRLQGGRYRVYAELLGARDQVLARSDVRLVRVLCQVWCEDEDDGD